MAHHCQVPPVQIISYGRGHEAPPEAHLTYDVADHFRDPHIDPTLRGLTARDDAIIRNVIGTPGVTRLINSIAESVSAYLRAPNREPITVAIGCVGGRHRSAVIAAEVAADLHAAGVNVTLTHRDIDKPVITRKEQR